MTNKIALTSNIAKQYTIAVLFELVCFMLLCQNLNKINFSSIVSLNTQSFSKFS